MASKRRLSYLDHTNMTPVRGSTDSPMIQPFESYGFARIDDWLESHVAFAVSLDRNQWRRRLIESYRDRLFRLRGRIAFCRGEGEPIDTPQMLLWLGQADSMAR